MPSQSKKYDLKEYRTHLLSLSEGLQMQRQLADGLWKDISPEEAVGVVACLNENPEHLRVRPPLLLIAGQEVPMPYKGTLQDFGQPKAYIVNYLMYFVMDRYVSSSRELVARSIDLGLCHKTRAAAVAHIKALACLHGKDPYNIGSDYAGLV